MILQLSLGKKENRVMPEEMVRLVPQASQDF
jgi:hypothetical protein